MTTTRYYQINGEFHTYEYWHDHEGYTLDATYNVTYKTTNPWGGAASESGYCDTAGSFDLFDFSFFIHGVVGWKTANELALEGYYLNADDGEEFLVEKDGVVSNAAMITDGTRSWYLIEEEIESGWMTQAEYEASGWQPYTPDESPKGYIVVDSTGAIQHSIDLDDMFIHQIQHSVEVVNFYFTPNGAAETENSELESGVDVPLYNADGTVADDDLYDGTGTLTYTQANGNMFGAADGGDLISLQSGALVMNPNADYTALSVQVEKWVPPEPEYLEGIIGETFTIPEGKTVDRLESQYLYFSRGGGDSYYYVFWKYEGESGYNWNNFWKYLPSYDLVKDLPYEGIWYVHSFATNSWVELNSSDLSVSTAGDPQVFVHPCRRPDYLVVYKNGEWEKMGSGAYTISGNTITFPANTNGNPSYGKPFRVYFVEQ